MTEPTDPAPTDAPEPTAPAPYDARSGDGDPRSDPAAIGEALLDALDADGGAPPEGDTVPEPGTGPGR